MQEKESKTNSHFQISLVKSLFRLLGFGLLYTGKIEFAAIVLILAELLGIREEF